MSVEAHFWVGKFLDDTFYVYDAALQPRPELRREDVVFVFLFPEIEIRDFSASTLRRIARRANRLESEVALTAYSSWRAVHLSAHVSAFEHAESKRIEQTIKERLENHRAFLERLGVAPAGTRPRSIYKPPRNPFCYACYEDLDSTVEFECVACGWLICQCGACGCGYKP